MSVIVMVIEHKKPISGHT